MKKTLVVIPCHNEEVNILDTIEDVNKWIKNADIIVVDNNSSDRTFKIAESSKVKVIREPKIGKGFAVRRGFLELSSEHDLVFLVDGDDTYAIEKFELAAEKILNFGFDMVIGTRIPVERGTNLRQENFRRGHVLGNRLLTKMYEILFGIKIQDTLSGWRLMTPGFVKSFTKGATGFQIESELNVHAFNLHVAVAEIPINYRGRKSNSDSKLSTYSDGFKILFSYLKLFFAERPFIAFTVISGPWAFMSLVLMQNVLKSYFRLGLIPNFPSLIASVGAFVVSTLLVTTGLILENVRIDRTSNMRALYNAK
jgi:glycosyltransferase involved in cell wall biosynthesis